MKNAEGRSDMNTRSLRERDLADPDNDQGESIVGSLRYLLNCIGTIIVKMLFSHVIIILSECCHKVEREYKSRIQDNNRQTKAKQAELSKKYKTMTVTYKVGFMAVLIYGVISSILQLVTTPVIQEDIVAFFTRLWKCGVGLYGLIEKLGRNAAGLAYLIENLTASGIVYWIICVAIMVVLSLAILFGSGFVIFLYGGYVRENQWDRHTMIAITTDIAITLFLAEEIRRLLPVNLVIIQISFFVVYSWFRYFICRFNIQT